MEFFLPVYGICIPSNIGKLAVFFHSMVRYDRYTGIHDILLETLGGN